MFNFIDHLHFYSCEWLFREGPQCTVLPGGYNAVKTAVHLLHINVNRRLCLKCTWTRH